MKGQSVLIDAHIHVFPEEIRRGRRRFCERDRHFAAIYGDPRARMASPEEVLGCLTEAGMDGAVILGFPWADVEVCRLHNDFLMDACRSSRGRLVGLGCVSPLTGEAGLLEAERCLEMGLQGIGEVAVYGPEGLQLGGPFFEGLAWLLVRRGLPLLLHTSESVGHAYPGKDRTDLRILYDWITNHPDLHLVLAHWGGGFFFYELMPEVRKACRKVYYDTAASPFLYSPKIYALALEIVGEDRILLGSDYPLIHPRRYLKEIQEQRIDPHRIRGLLGENARKLWEWDTGLQRQ